MQPAEAKADPAEWAEGQLQPTSQATESHGSAPSAGVTGADADTAESAAAGGDGCGGSRASSAAAEGAGQEDGLQNMQTEAAVHELDSSLLNKGE